METTKWSSLIVSEMNHKLRTVTSRDRGWRFRTGRTSRAKAALETTEQVSEGNGLGFVNNVSRL